MTREEIQAIFGPLGDLKIHPSAPDDMLVVLATTNGGIIDTSIRLTAGALRKMQAALKQA